MTFDRDSAPLAHATPYTYRRRLGARDLLSAFGIGLGVGAVAFYVAAVLRQRTPLAHGPVRSRRGAPQGRWRAAKMSE